MTDPASSGAAGAAAFKAVGGASAVAAGGASLAAVVVMLMTPPRSPREWTVGLISTVVSSIGGGAASIEHFGLHQWVNAPIGLCAMAGLIFACGLPGWAIVRWVFNFIDRNRDVGIDEAVRMAKLLLGEKRKPQRSRVETKEIMLDCTEQPTQRSSDDARQREYYSGKEKRQTVKTECLVTEWGRMSASRRAEIATLPKDKYPGLGAKLVSEKPRELEGIAVSHETARHLRIATGLCPARTGRVRTRNVDR